MRRPTHMCWGGGGGEGWKVPQLNRDGRTGCWMHPPLERDTATDIYIYTYIYIYIYIYRIACLRTRPFAVIAQSERDDDRHPKPPTPSKDSRPSSADSRPSPAETRDDGSACWSGRHLSIHQSIDRSLKDTQIRGPAQPRPATTHPLQHADSRLMIAIQRLMIAIRRRQHTDSRHRSAF